MRKVAFVLAGGFCGTLARYLLAAPLMTLASRALPRTYAGVPYDVLAINLCGALAMGVLYGLVEHGLPFASDLRLALGTGFLGAFTTFSSLAYGGDRLLASGAFAAGSAYLLGSMILGILCAHAGYIAAHRLATSRRALARATASVRTARWTPLERQSSGFDPASSVPHTPSPSDSSNAAARDLVEEVR
jgi:fluoride exporter